MRYCLSVLPYICIAACFLVSGGAAKAAPVLRVDSNGQLVGATGVAISGVGTYDVTFLEGTCIEVFSGCDEASDFDLKLPNETIAASEALLDQVFVGRYDDDPTLTYGCSDKENCVVFTPAEVFLFSHAVGYVSGTAAANTEIGNPVNDFLAPNGDYGPLADRDLSTDDNLTGDGRRVWARWSSSARVPEPGTLTLIMVTLAGAASTYRRRL